MSPSPAFTSNGAVVCGATGCPASVPVGCRYGVPSAFCNSTVTVSPVAAVSSDSGMVSTFTLAGVNGRVGVGLTRVGYGPRARSSGERSGIADRGDCVHTVGCIRQFVDTVIEVADDLLVLGVDGKCHVVRCSLQYEVETDGSFEWLQFTFDVPRDFDHHIDFVPAEVMSTVWTRAVVVDRAPDGHLDELACWGGHEGTVPE